MADTSTTPPVQPSGDKIADVYPSRTIITSISIYFPMLFLGFIAYETILQSRITKAYCARKRRESTTCPPGEKTYSVFGWIWPVLRIPDDDITKYCGLDAIGFIRIIRMGQKFASFGILVSIVLFPLYATGVNPHEDTRKDIDPLERISMSNLKQGEWRLWGSLVVMYAMSLFAMYLMLNEYKDYTTRRHELLGRAGPQQYSAVINYLPKEFRMSQTLQYYMDYLFPSQVHSVQVAVECAELEKLVEKRAEVRSSLEHALVEYGSTGKRPTHSNSKCGMGPKLDSIQYYEAKLDRLNISVAQEIEAIENYERECAACVLEERLPGPASTPPGDNASAEGGGGGGDTASSTSPTSEKEIYNPKRSISNIRVTMRQSAFVSFTSLKAAQSCQQLLQSESPVEMDVGPAPHPKDVVWGNIGNSRKERVTWQLTSWCLTILIILFWTIPSSFVASLATVERLTELMPWLENAFKEYPWLQDICKQLSPLGLVLMSLIANKVFGILARREGHPSETEISASHFSKLVYFQIFQIFFISIIAGTVFESLEQVINEPKLIISMLGTSMPGQSTNFMAFLILQLGLSLTLELLRVIPFIFSVVYNIFAPSLTARERRTPFMGFIQSINEPGHLDQAIRLPIFFQAILLVFAFCAIAPLLTYFAGLFFLVADIVYRRQLVFVYDPIHYSTGVFWPRMHDFLVGALFLAQITFLGLISLKVAPGPIFFATILPFGTIAYYMHTNSLWPKTAAYLPLSICCRIDETRSQSSDASSWDFLVSAYKQPALREKEELRPEVDEEPGTQRTTIDTQAEPRLGGDGPNETTNTHPDEEPLTLTLASQPQRLTLPDFNLESELREP